MTTAKVYYDPSAYTSTGSTVDEHIKGIDDAIDTLNTAVATPTDLTTDVTGTLPVANGGTSLATLNTYEMLAGGTTATGALQQIGNGTSGDPLVSAGAGALPAFGKLTIEDSISGLIEFPTAGKTYVIWQNIPYAITTLSLTSICTTGTCNTILRNKGVSDYITNATSTTQTVGTHTDTWSVGDDLAITINGLSGAQYVSFTVKFTREIP